MALTTPSPPVRRRMTKKARRFQLLATAEQVFGELGYQGATMDEIATRSGVARSLLYQHFDSLDEIYLECLRTARAELDDRLLAAAAQPGVHAERLRAGIRAYFGFVRDHGTSWDVLFVSGPAPNAAVNEVSTELRFRTAEHIALLFRAEFPQVDPAEAHAYAHAVSGAGEQLAHWWRRNPTASLDTVVEHMMTVVWSGLESIVRRFEVSEEGTAER